MKKFNESLDTAVFTTKYIIEDKTPILYVFHDEDGSWQFHGGEDNVAEKDARLVSLEEILRIDPTILEIADLPINFEAFRSSKDGTWKITSSN